MKDEKILQEEMFSDEELDKVAGGTYKESWEDYQNFVNLTGGKYVDPNWKRYHNYMVQEAFQNLGKDLGINIKAEINYKDKVNHYFVDGTEVSREEIWRIVKEAYEAKKK